jgi:hypothetical protein
LPLTIGARKLKKIDYKYKILYGKQHHRQSGNNAKVRAKALMEDPLIYKIIRKKEGRVWWSTPGIPALRRLK